MNIQTAYGIDRLGDIFQNPDRPVFPGKTGQGISRKRSPATEAPLAGYFRVPPAAVLSYSPDRTLTLKDKGLGAGINVYA